MNNNNVDSTEVDKFSAASAHWWDTEGEFKPLHIINPLRLAFIEMTTSLRDKTILDVGCGGGILAESMASRGGLVTGIDMSQESLKVAKLHQLESGIQVQYEHCTAEQMATDKPARFDIVTCLEMLEHVPNPASCVNACAALIKPGGIVFFSTLNRNLKSYLYGIIGAEYLLKLVPKFTHDYARFIKPAELAAWGREAGLQLGEIKGIKYHMFSNKFTLSSDASVNYLMYFRKPE
jgi:2-polyprenyl-6-hydroxyphenyl methylase/3-demethylubiquinone-9 3-methyltransferase